MMHSWRRHIVLQVAIYPHLWCSALNAFPRVLNRDPEKRTRHDPAIAFPQVAALGVVLRTAAAGAAVAAPLVGFQYYGWLQHCGPQSAATAGELPPWCSQRIPYLYGYVQSHYWGVGFLRYWQPQQVRS